MCRVEAHYASCIERSAVPLDMPNLHPDAVCRVRQSVLKRLNMTSCKPAGKESVEGIKRCPSSIGAQNQDSRLSDLNSWPTPADAAAM